MSQFIISASNHYGTIEFRVNASDACEASGKADRVIDTFIGEFDVVSIEEEAHEDTDTRCHCGSPYRGSDHCSECGCEQYESDDCGAAA